LLHASSSEALRGELNVWGLVGVILFYVVILVIGVLTSWRTRSWKTESSEDVMVAGRNIGLVVGVFTMTCQSLLAANIL
jgi:high affinity choline transporter 7